MTKASAPGGLSLAGAGLALMMALTGCGASSPAPGAAGPSRAAAGPSRAAAAIQTPVPAVRVPKYVAADNARQDVSATSCVSQGARGWLATGTAANSSGQARGYSIVVDFVMRTGDTVLATRVVRVRRVAPRSSARWSARGAAGQTRVACVIRQALARP